MSKVTHAAGNVVSPAKVTLPVKSDIAQRPKFKFNDTTHRADTAKIRIYKPDQVGDNTNITVRNGSWQTQLVKVGGILYQVNRNGHIVSLQVNGNTVDSGEQQRYLDIIGQSKPPVAQVAQVSQPAVPAVVARPAPTARDYARQQQSYAANPYPKDIEPYHDDNNSNKLTAGLIEDGIVQTPKDLRSFKLSDTEFIVNGKKMPDDVYQKYKTLYVPKTNQKGSWSWMFNYDEH